MLQQKLFKSLLNVGKSIYPKSSASLFQFKQNYSSQVDLGPTNLLINGEFVEAESGKRFETLSPVDGSVITTVAEGDAADVDKAVDAARHQFDDGEWSQLTGEDRGKLLYKLADLVEENAEWLAKLETLDNGKPVAVAQAADLDLTIQHYRYYAGWADKIHGMVLPGRSGFHTYTNHQAVGVAGQIIPWNFPLLMQAWKLGPALAAGCTSVMKLAEQTPLSGLALGSLFKKAGFPDGVVNIITGFGPTAGGRLVEHPLVDKIAFTGSTEVGKEIMRGAADTLKRVTLELGGKSPNIIFPDADLDQAIEGAHFGLFFNQGQCCCAGSRVFVHEDIYDEFVEKSVARAKSRTVGDPFDEKIEQGPQVSEEQMNIILNYIESGKRDGANLVAGGSRIGDKGYFIEPTIFADVQDDHTIAREEIFGPVMSILKFKDIDEVARRANDSIYGLAAGIWTKDGSTATRLAHKLRAGTVWINCYDVLTANAPFGGFKQSGIGRELGPYGLRNYLESQTVTSLA